jgi:2-methylisocitrate lyase-like PEP mutase family enzyme
MIAAVLDRGRAYAGGLFVPGPNDLRLIADLTKALPLPVNIMVSQGADV